MELTSVIGYIVVGSLFFAAVIHLLARNFRAETEPTDFALIQTTSLTPNHNSASESFDDGSFSGDGSKSV